MTRYHPESPDIAAADLARLRFVAELRSQLHNRLGRGNRAIYRARLAKPQDATLQGEAAADRREELRGQMEQEPYYQLWSSLLRLSQDLMWRLVDQSVAQDMPKLQARLAALADQQGSLELDPMLEPPEYLRRADTHRMPGSYFSQTDPEDMRAGALYDLGSAIYQFGRGNQHGQLLNDSRGRAIVAHLTRHFPTLAPYRILDLGCSAGQNTLPLCEAYPQARVDAIDIGAPMLRYARLRTVGLGGCVHFSQRNAEATGFADQSFDLVVSQILFHETSPEAVTNIIQESYRLLKPGGVAVHLEVPIRFEHLDVFDQFLKSWEQYYNGESNTIGVAAADLKSEMARAGFDHIRAGFQPTGPASQPAPSELLDRPPTSGRCLYVVSGVRTQDGAETALPRLGRGACAQV
jgi:ubiquinone/menaquinone biosynthesis C-methylase UbiE